MEYLQYRYGLFIATTKKGVLNLVISGIPSILITTSVAFNGSSCFKPCYKWNTFNTLEYSSQASALSCFKPCYKWNTFNTIETILMIWENTLCFKPCYKWNTFNTLDFDKNTDFMVS